MHQEVTAVVVVNLIAQETCTTVVAAAPITEAAPAAVAKHQAQEKTKNAAAPATIAAKEAAEKGEALPGTVEEAVEEAVEGAVEALDPAA